MSSLLSVNELPLLVTLLQQADPSLDELAARVNAAFAASRSQVRLTFARLENRFLALRAVPLYLAFCVCASRVRNSTVR